MANVLATCTILAKEGLAVLENMLGFSSNVNREWEEEFTTNQSRGYSPGVTINIKRPPRYTYRAGRVAVPQSTVETTIPLTLVQGGTDMSYLSVERTLSLQSMEQKLQAAMATVANEIDRQGLLMALNNVNNLNNAAGALPATTLAAVQIFTNANRRMDEMAAPRDRQRAMCAGPALNAGLVAGLSGLFNAQSKLTEQYGSGMVVDSFGMNFALDQNVPSFTNGGQAITGTTHVAGQVGSNITIGALAGTVTRGTIVTFPLVFAVNPQSRVSTGVLAEFVVTADLAAGATVLPISPPIVPAGQFQNVTAATNGVANWLIISGVAGSTYGTNFAYHKDAFTLAAVPLWTPPSGKGVIDAASASYKGMNMRVIQFYDRVNDNSIFRFDVLFGWAATYPELAVRIQNV